MGFRLDEQADVITVVLTSSTWLRIWSASLAICCLAFIPLLFGALGASFQSFCVSLPFIIGLASAISVLAHREEVLVRRDVVVHRRRRLARGYVVTSLPVGIERFHCAHEPRFFSLGLTPSQRLRFADMEIGQRALTEASARELADCLNRFLSDDSDGV